MQFASPAPRTGRAHATQVLTGVGRGSAVAAVCLPSTGAPPCARARVAPVPAICLQRARDTAKRWASRRSHRLLQYTSLARHALAGTQAGAGLPLGAHEPRMSVSSAAAFSPFTLRTACIRSPHTHTSALHAQVGGFSFRGDPMRDPRFFKINDESSTHGSSAGPFALFRSGRRHTKVQVCR